ncbi:hypothetical protein CC2G_003508 [Coprinopsis cinerea AmutBmut pab1-1]|nr:hypothetical protein CC2G_003508 [Coprinopsis cinerea AmutBmut pab1-1]
MSIQHLPPEIVDFILELLVENAPDGHSISLARCSLVCRTFRPTSQRLLFRSISLKVILASKIPPLIDTLKSNPDTFGSYVQKLSLTPLRWSSVGGTQRVTVYPNDIDRENSPLNTFVDIVPNLKHIRIDASAGSWATFPSRMKEHIEGIVNGTIPSQVDSLEFFSVPDLPPGLLLSASRIKSVTISDGVQVQPRDLRAFLQNVTSNSSSGAEVSSSTITLSLQSLNFRSLFFPPSLFTISPSVLANLTTLSVKISSRNFPPAIVAAQGMLDACNGSLETLDIQWRMNRHWNFSAVGTLDLRGFKSLKHLKLQTNSVESILPASLEYSDLALSPKDQADPRPFKLLVDTLASIGSPSSLQSLEIAIEGLLSVEGDEIPPLHRRTNPTFFMRPLAESVKACWDDLDEMLSSITKFPTLRTVDLNCTLETRLSGGQIWPTPVDETTRRSRRDEYRRYCSLPSDLLPRTQQTSRVHLTSYFHLLYGC